ncbi:MAG: polysaccharide polymerase [Symploca sp. SIO3C6]|uniref:Polysaccharide polymerase n=1 Tax=Symploca sp. SIO1C4 TaxID=2607765 RepID=A0A6B3NFN9_9CYAN|nr:polysaccharide polymerase [Symploca sp. SIO3C6]NER30487.1 polysaccharide polymerase [Symploca sp. SIO1C4]NET06582.1 polysaccharide polymerase [Symploca sp. SIO2B6]
MLSSTKFELPGVNFSTPKQVKEILHNSLKSIGEFDDCALLDYPNHCNVGDHLIWLGEIFYLTDVLKTKINYTANISNFNAEKMEQQIGNAPILLSGGGNLGDLWLHEQNFREKIISRYQDRPIIILPQTVYFSEPENLRKAANIFNNHPNLTLFVRCHQSYKTATKYFYNCRVFMAPDMAFQLVGMPGLKSQKQQKESILFLCREDKELNQEFEADYIGIDQITVEDWSAFRYKHPQPKIWTIPGMIKVVSEARKQGNLLPREWISRQLWKYLHSYTDKFEQIYDPNMQRKSWNFMHHAVYQFSQYDLVITNRLHGHILCLILGIPHVLLPNAYYKNEYFYESWTSQISFCRFVKSATQIKPALQDLLDTKGGLSTMY